MAKGRKIRRLVFVLLGLMAVIAAAVAIVGYVGLSSLPGGRDSVSFARVLSAGEVRYTVPAEVLQAEIAKIFPLTQGVEGLVRLHMRDPQFMSDADASFLRLGLVFEAQIVGTNDHLPGRAVVRTQLRFDPATSKVMLARASLAEFAFTGQSAALGESLRPVLQTALAAEMEGYPIFEMPENSEWWARAGFSWVRDITVVDGRVVIVLGR